MSAGKENSTFIGIYGRRNVGKSSLINNLCQQEVSIVSDYKGTTTDPVKRSFEIIGFGPVVFIDTGGIDDYSEIGKLRVNKTLKTIESIDLAIIVISNNKFGNSERKIISNLNKLHIPYFILLNKTDITTIDNKMLKDLNSEFNVPIIKFSSLTGFNRDEVFSLIKTLVPRKPCTPKRLLDGIIKPNDIVLLITPIDSEAPEGRLILPQVKTIRNILDNNCISIVLKEDNIERFLETTNIKPKLAITDSQIFAKADKLIPKDVPLTGFSLLIANESDYFEDFVKGTYKLSKLENGDRVLILESCSHQEPCDDIGRYKIPKLIQNFTKKDISFTMLAGLDSIPVDIKDYSLVIQCGSCVISKRQMHNKLQPVIEAEVSVSNYEMAIAYMNGVYNRAIEIFLDKKKINTDLS